MAPTEVASTCWQIELDDAGDVPALPGDDEGCLRVACGDSIVFNLPAGSTPTLCRPPALITRDELFMEDAFEFRAEGTIGDWSADWRPARPGPYELFVRYVVADAGGSSKQGPAFRIIVDPTLRINGEPLAARSLVQLTVLSRLAGPIERWPESLASQASLGYNMVHFTPIQPPGESGSCYSLDDQNSVDATLMEAPAADDAGRLAAVARSVERLEKECGMLSATDIVLNHTAGTSPWLLEHPECAYNVSNSPHLLAAAELDQRISWYSSELRDGRLGGPHIRSHDDVSRVIEGVKQHVLQHLDLREYFRVDEEACRKAFAESTAAVVPFERDDYAAFKDAALPSVGSRRHGVVVPGAAARRFCSDEAALLKCLTRLQADLLSVFDGVERDILDALRGLIAYERLELQKGPVGDGHLMLVTPYFRRLDLSPGAQKRLGQATELVAHNGWVMDWPATEDFAAPTWRFVYLRRHLCAWGDCVKLRYGSEPADAPYLWKHMTKYATSMGSIFHAIRLDNAHSTPLHVSSHMLAQLRKTSPHCWVFAELFTGNFQTDLLYQRTLGINALIREAMQCDSPWDIANKLTSNLWGAHPIGALSSVRSLDRVLTPQRPRHAGPVTRSASFALIPATALPLRPRLCPALLYDCTHDNETPKQKRHARDALPNAALVAASCASMGSVRGYDELFAINPSVVFERTPYKKVDGVAPLSLELPNASSPKLTPVAEEFQAKVLWPHSGAKSVVARGAWDGWQQDLPLAKQSDGRWSAQLSVKRSACPLQYKFVVDGTWTTDQGQPTANDGNGNTNNVIRGPGDEEGAARITGPDVLDHKLPGIMAVKQVLNALHVRLAQEGFVEIGVERLAEDIFAVQRRAPDTGRTAWFVARSAYSRHGLDDKLPQETAALEISGVIARLHVAATLFVPDGDGRTVNGRVLSGLQCDVKLYGSMGEVAHCWREGRRTKLQLHQFPPGSVLAFSTDPASEAHLVADLDQLLTFDVVAPLLEDLTLSELNYLLFSCDAEEQDRSGGKRGAYDIPGHGPLVYCGLMGVCAALDEVREARPQPLDTPLARNAREGEWLLDYLSSRLGDMPALSKVQTWLQQAGAVVTQFPRHLVPFYFDMVVSALCSAAGDALLKGSNGFFSKHAAMGSFVRDLALATAQFWGATSSAPLHWDRAKVAGWRAVPSLCAGLPHFSAGFMRNWGRDTFIALRGCLLVTGRFAEARETLLVYASVVRHGLCPNLLDAANRPRYNARDATWFFLQSIQDYVEMSPEGETFLKTPVELKWPVGEWDADLADLEPRTIADLVHLILAAHAKGIAFREWNAGSAIDEHMTDTGFDISVTLDETTGIIYGGNEWNCGTWMDKMGSSARAGNKGVPATPRDGAPVEIIGLLKSTLRWVSGLAGRGIFPKQAVRTTSGAELTYKEWDTRLQTYFERLFWISPDERCGAALRGIYKDTVGATRQWQDAQLRPNFCIAMAVAPELFTPEYARVSLEIVAERLVGPLGMCTLDPGDPEYRGDYHNDDDSEDKAVAHGWNYHQGPEWVWPLGFFLRAWQRFGPVDGPRGAMSSPQRAQLALRWLLEHRRMLSQDPWRSLPELTNSKGQVCGHSCPAQAWSIATLLDALRSIELGSGP